MSDHKTEEEKKDPAASPAVLIALESKLASHPRLVGVLMEIWKWPPSVQPTRLKAQKVKKTGSSRLIPFPHLAWGYWEGTRALSRIAHLVLDDHFCRNLDIRFGFPGNTSVHLLKEIKGVAGILVGRMEKQVRNRVCLILTGNEIQIQMDDAGKTEKMSKAQAALPETRVVEEDD